jgi:hypothetical protein
MAVLDEHERERVRKLAENCWDRDWDFDANNFEILIDYIEDLVVAAWERR